MSFRLTFANTVWLIFAFMENLTSLINNLKKEIADFSSDEDNPDEIFRIKYLGSNGLVKYLMSKMREVPAENRKEVGKELNELKLMAEDKLDLLKRSAINKQPTTNLESCPSRLPNLTQYRTPNAKVYAGSH